MNSQYIKPESVKALEDLATAEARRRHPSMPHLAPRVFRDDSTSGLTGCITAYLKLQGAFVSRLDNMGVYDRRTGRYRPGTNRKGLPDVVCTYQGKSIFIEVKHGRDRMSEHQEKIRQEHEQCGGLYYVAKDFTQFKNWFDTI